MNRNLNVNIQVVTVRFDQCAIFPYLGLRGLVWATRHNWQGNGIKPAPSHVWPILWPSPACVTDEYYVSRPKQGKMQMGCGSNIYV